MAEQRQLENGQAEQGGRAGVPSHVLLARKVEGDPL